jgi:type III pantothenate kinase
LVNAYAALVKYGAPCVVVDFGTATTFDCVTAKGAYSGGLIVPGPNLAAESLSLHTAKLPRVSMAKPSHLIGKDTIESIQSGLYYGYVSLVDGVLARLMKEMGKKTIVIATGGLAGLIAGDSKFIRKDLIDPDLTLRGIYLSWKAR